MRPNRIALLALVVAVALTAAACVLHDALFGFALPTITTRSASEIALPYREGPGGLMLIRGATTRVSGEQADIEYVFDTGAPITVVLAGPATESLRLDTAKAQKLGPADNPAVPSGVIEKGFGIDFGALAVKDLSSRRPSDRR